MLGRILLCTSLAALAVAAIPRSAAACGACSCYDHELDLVPSFSRHLPLNARLFALVPGSDTSAVRWTRESDKADVPIDLTPAGGPENAYWITPHDPLDPDTDYRITTAPGLEWVLTTGQATDATPLEVSASITPSGPTDICAGLRGGVLKIEKLSFGPDWPDGSLLQLDVTGPSGTERLFMPTVSGVPQLFPFGAATSGEVSCVGARALKDARIGVTYTAKLTAFDTAGNGTSIDLPPFQLDEMAGGGCGGPSGTGGNGGSGGSGGSSGSGCTVSTGSAEGVGALIPLALLALARFGSRVARRRSTDE